MGKVSTFPFYFPTTVVFVDDNKEFLKNFSLQFSDDLAYCLFDEPERALEFLNSKNQVSLDKRCFTHYQNLMRENREQRIYHLDLNLIEREVSNPERFSDVSVLVVDYAMKDMNGVEFCEKINNPRIKKILFTGVADEQIAVEAFNSGSIDRFLRKSEPDITRVLENTIDELKQRYFEDVSFMIKNTLEISEPLLFQNSAFEGYLKHLLHEYGFVEYYYVEDPLGFLLVTASGEVSRLVIFSEQDIEEQIQACQAHDFPTESVTFLINREKVAYFWQNLDDLGECSEDEWQDFFYDAVQVEGVDKYYFALVDNAPVDIEFNQDESNFQNYLDRLDEAQQSF